VKTPDYDVLAELIFRGWVGREATKSIRVAAAALKAAHAAGLRDGAERARQEQCRHDERCPAACRCADGYHVAAALDAAADVIAPPSSAPESARAPADAAAGSGNRHRAEASAATREPGG
jgi:hypothetical protein